MGIAVHHLVDFVGRESVCLLADLLTRLLARTPEKADDGARFLVDPVLPVLHAGSVLDLEAELVGLVNSLYRRVDVSVAVREARIDGPRPICGSSYPVTWQFVRAVCHRTTLRGLVPLSVAHPAGIAFCWEQGIGLEFGDSDLGTLERLFDRYGSSALEIRSLERARVRVTLREGGDELRLTFDSHPDPSTCTGGPSATVIRDRGQRRTVVTTVLS